MANPKLDKPATVTPIREGAMPAGISRPAVFTFDDDEEEGPEMSITRAGKRQAGPEMLQQGIDLTGKKKIIIFLGRGKTGKTTTIRLLAETALSTGATLIMADMDPTNDTFSKYVEGVSRPSDPTDPALSLKWLDRLLQHALKTEQSVVIDLGGGDTTFRRLAEQIPELVTMFEAAGFAVVMFYNVGPQEEDLSPLATMLELGFKPTAMAIVLNEALADVGEPREAAFARVFRHSAFQAACDAGAVPVWMPRLLPVQQVEVRRLPFRKAVEGATGQGKTPLGPFDRARVKAWLDAVDISFAGIKTWLP